jgi:hypothetical protein
MFSMRALILGAAATLGLALAGGSAAATQTAPTCGPATLNNSAQADGLVTLSPLPGSRDASPRSQVSFLGVPAGELRGVRVVGSRSGAHSGRLAAYSQGDGASFLPSRPFVQGERVTVSATLRAAGRTRALRDQFAIAREDPIGSTPEAIHPGSASQAQSFRSRPDLHPPVVGVTARLPGASSSDEFVAPYAGPGQAGPMILDAGGGLVWFKALPTYTSAADFQVQEYAGRPVLTWWQGEVSVHGFGLGQDVIADSAYDDIAHVRAGNGEEADLHEFQLTPQGAALITAYHPILCNLSAVGGPPDAGVTDSLIQEIDVRTGLVMWEWTSIDHVGLADSHASAASSSAAFPFDFFHLNAIDVDRAGTLLVSSRNTWTVYAVDPRSGRIVWRLGGRHSTFKMGAGTGTAWQHDPRELPDGTISMFDNGASPKVHAQSRAVVVSVDPRTRTATLVAKLTHDPPLLSESEGNVQALAGGGWFVGWGQEPFFSEYGPGGELLFDAHLPPFDRSYRDFRFAWSGAPVHPPTFAFQAAPIGAGTVYASWNGATEVASWRVLAGPGATSLQPVAQAARSGFETAVAIPPATHGPYVAVQALDASGNVLGASPAAAQAAFR